MRGLSPKDVVVDEILREIVSPPLFQILNLCGAVRVGESSLRFSHAFICMFLSHLSKNKARNLYFFARNRQHFNHTTFDKRSKKR